MSKCKNCYYCYLCNLFNAVNKTGISCPYFKDDSLIVELPCKIGDTVYKIEGGEIYPIMILNIIISDCDTEFNGFEIDEEGNESNDDSVCLSEFGKTVFITREAAEKALEEQKSGE